FEVERLLLQRDVMLVESDGEIVFRCGPRFRPSVSGGAVNRLVGGVGALSCARGGTTCTGEVRGVLT
ncbi:MAG: hypothetical protein QF619_14065, partial [Candidatus Binatia bacterium]|nr:hypothetical protein [Candidatus Binatia bacterium]